MFTFTRELYIFIQFCILFITLLQLEGFPSAFQLGAGTVAYFFMTGTPVIVAGCWARSNSLRSSWHLSPGLEPLSHAGHKGAPVFSGLQ